MIVRSNGNMTFNTKGWYKNLTPELAWKKYVGTSVELFISNFRADGIYDLKKACMFHANELSADENTLFTTDQLELIANLWLKYIEKYIEQKGGIDKLELYTTEELDKIAEKEWGVVRKLIKKYYKW